MYDYAHAFVVFDIPVLPLNLLKTDCYKMPFNIKCNVNEERFKLNNYTKLY